MSESAEWYDFADVPNDATLRGHGAWISIHSRGKGMGWGVGGVGWGGGGILPDPFRTSRLSWSLSTLLSPRDVYLPEVGKDHWDGVIVEDDLTRDGCVCVRL